MSEPAPARSGALTGPVEVVGAGLLGTSIGLACRRAGLEVLLSDVSPENVRTASGLGAGRARTAADTPQLVVVAVPPDHLGAEVARALAGGAVVTDVGSIKTGPLRAVAGLAGRRAVRRRAPDGGQRALRPARRQRRAVRRPARGRSPRTRRPTRPRSRWSTRWSCSAGPCRCGSRPRSTTARWPAPPTCRTCSPCWWPAGSPTRRPSTWRSRARACATSPGSPPATPRCGSRS